MFQKCGRSYLTNNFEMDPVSQVDRSEHELSLKKCIEFVENDMSPALSGCDPTKQDEADAVV